MTWRRLLTLAILWLTVFQAEYCPLRADTAKAGPQVPWARLRFRAEGGDDDNWNVHPIGDLNLMDEINRKTSANVEPRWHVADVGSLEEMTQFPFLFMHAESAPDLTDKEKANLREYLLRGGFLFAEDCVTGKNRTAGRSGWGDIFFGRMLQVLDTLIPGAKIERLPDDHPVFRCVYRMPDGIPHMQGIKHGLYGLRYKGRMLALLSPSDIHCGWSNGDEWFGRGSKAECLKMGINIYIYAMTQAE